MRSEKSGWLSDMYWIRMPLAFEDLRKENQASGVSAIGFSFVLPKKVLLTAAKFTLSQNLHVEFSGKKFGMLCPCK